MFRFRQVEAPRFGHFVDPLYELGCSSRVGGPILLLATDQEVTDIVGVNAVVVKQAVGERIFHFDDAEQQQVRNQPHVANPIRL